MSTAPVSTRNDLADAADDDWSPITATDGELLMRFTRHRDAVAFAEIVERHAGMVWIVCREALGQRQDVEDAFQATFFILAEQAAKIRSCDSAAAWLYKVAQRTSLAARRKRAQRREEELTTEPPHQVESERLIHDQQMIYVLMEELRSLPERYRTPLVLRYLEGRTRRTIAAQTDSTLPQVQGRLVRGRRMLRSRMAQRGVSLASASGVMAALVAEASAAVPTSLAAATTKGCLGLVASGAASGASVAAIELAKQGIKAMWLASFMKSSAVVSAVFVAAGVAWAVESGVGGTGAGSNPAPAANVVALKSDGEGEAKAKGEKENGTQARTDALVTAEATYQKRLAETRDELAELIDGKVSRSAGLELSQSNKADIQREIAQLKDKRLELKMLQYSETPKDKDTERKREELLDVIDTEISRRTEELKKVVQEVARASIDVEILQMNLKLKQARLEELDRLANQVKNDAQFTPLFDWADTNTKIDKSANGKLEPSDAIRVQVANAFADQPLNSVYAIEPMGTVALGPAYGRVNVTGMTVLEAEEAIKKHLEKVIDKPEVQVTLSEKQSSVRDLQQVQSVVEKLRAENDQLKAMLQDMHKQSEGVRSENSSSAKDVLRPGDPIEVTLFPRDSKDSGQVLRLRVNGDGQVQIDPKMGPIEISGVDERRAEKIIRDYFGTPTSRYQEVRVRRFNP